MHIKENVSPPPWKKSTCQLEINSNALFPRKINDLQDNTTTPPLLPATKGHPEGPHAHRLLPSDSHQEGIPTQNMPQNNRCIKNICSLPPLEGS